MNNVKQLIALRDGIDDLLNELMLKSDNGVILTEDVLRATKSRLKSLISRAQADLIDIALKRIIDNVGRRKAGRRGGIALANLFGEYPNIPQMLVIGGSKRKSTAKTSIGELVSYLDAHSPKAVSERNEGLRRLVDDVVPYKHSDRDTIEDLVARKKRLSSQDELKVFQWERDKQEPVSGDAEEVV